MVTFPNAKINLGLHVVARRADGFHDLETVFLPVGWSDVLEIVPDPAAAAGVHFSVSGREAAALSDNNLVTDACRLLAQTHPLPPLRVHLHKILPTGAGLGGGSADATFALRTINELAGLGLTAGTLEGLASQLGSDCAFFVKNRPVLATGRGQVFEPIALDLAGWHLLLVFPGLPIATAEAYGRVRAQPPAADLRAVLAQPVDTWRHALVNDFEAALFPVYPQLARLKEELYDHGAGYAAMSGSGSTLYGLFRHPPPAAAFQRKPYLTWCGPA